MCTYHPGFPPAGCKLFEPALAYALASGVLPVEHLDVSAQAHAAFGWITGG
jgi:hypothetical protein